MDNSTLGGQQRILSFAIKDRNALYQSYMPFVKNGGGRVAPEIDIGGQGAIAGAEENGQNTAIVGFV